MQKIAILGNGQLAQMMQDVSGKLDLNVTAFELPEIHADGSCDEVEIKKWVRCLKDFDVVTYEIENIPVQLLKEVENHVPVYPAVDALAASQDRLLEKQLFTSLDIQTNDFMAVSSKEELIGASKQLGFPFVLKTRRFGYDGKGQYVLKSQEDIDPAWRELGEYALLAEAFISFDYEVSQIASRNRDGSIAYYPVVRNEHREGILRETHVLDFSDAIIQQAQNAIKKVLENFDYVGTLAIEFFVKDEQLYVNEMAPRVHNSGHWSIDGAETSQFENHLRAVAGLELGSTKSTHSHAMMINLIGEDILDSRLDHLERVYLKSYGKLIRPNRKMGHINIVSDSKEQFVNVVQCIYQKVEAKPCLQEDLGTKKPF